ncbi:MAG TPA: GGDEF domain-containing protein [Thermodesulfatator atlanticus]|uniref:diguanylate cyclase n=1 Tax=Thermodesulfatator atlanticus TaxID=501497 RepID=A0A7V5NYL3_9BACT|nr:GGDEF domain-containing protein [Thermodesulfatator atlanticus]
MGYRSCKLIRFLLNLSLFWKVGFVIAICVAINTLIAFYFHAQLHKLKDHLERAPIYAYKSLAQEGLYLLERLEEASAEEKERIRNAIRKLAYIGLQGGIYEKGNQKIIQIVSSVKDPYLKDVLTRLVKANSYQEMQKEFQKILDWSLKEEEKLQKELGALSENASSFYLLIFGILILCLIWGGLAFFFMVKRPLDIITKKIDNLFIEGEHYCLEDPQYCEWKHEAEDEIGKLSEAVKNLLRNYTELAIFKHTIEEDQTVKDVYERLAQVFKEKLGIEAFALYEVSNSQNTMTVVHLSPPDLEVNHEKLFNANFCRAKRTGHVINSIIQPRICSLFLWKDEAEHYCVPFMSGGQCIGVAQIILPKTPENRRSKRIKEKLRIAERYIREAVPVIEAKRYAESLKDQTLKDPLTGLYNRRFLEEAIDNLIAGILRRKTVLGVLMADLDYFKSINDRYGHDIGDKILKETAKLLKKHVRASDLVVRFGGEEFLILLVDVKEGDSLKIAEKLRSIVEAQEFETPKGVIKRTISIGVSEFPVDAKGIWEAIKYADVALYKAKEGGRNKVVRFTRDMWSSKEY